MPLTIATDFIYLASQSPRRSQLLDQLGVRHELLLPDADEDAEGLEKVWPNEAPKNYVRRVTGLKLAAAQQRLERRQLPPALAPYRNKLFGLTIQPERLSEIRNERRPNSRYASLANCRMEVSEAEAMMRRAGIRWLSTTTKSIEEIATTILQEVPPERVAY